MAFPIRLSIPDSAPVGSAPLSGVNGAPLWNVKKDPTCQPPRIFPAIPCCDRMTGSCHTKLPVSRCGRS